MSAVAVALTSTTATVASAIFVGVQVLLMRRQLDQVRAMREAEQQPALFAAFEVSRSNFWTVSFGTPDKPPPRTCD